MAAPGARPVRRVLARVEGVVQGVGFRPFAHRLAGELGLAGTVRNDARGVVVEVEGAPAAVAGFLARLASDAPPLAVVERVLTEDVAPSGERGFAIVESTAGGRPDALVSADVATCADCLRELFDPADRRFRYPFLNCTNCGPRFTIVRGVPYDRSLTTMAGFPMCAACRAEYDDPADRRFHAQPVACPACGPALRLAGARGDPLPAVVAALRAGGVVAIKGLGGFHLACPAADEAAVAALRARKHREDKPFALMAGSVAAAAALVELGEGERALLESRERPIVLARRRAGAPVAAAVAPRAGELGVMLPYTPLHHLLLADVGEPLVMTSGNVSDEPIAYEDADALERLSRIADVFLLHDRPIHMRTDDSVVRVAGARRLTVRRSRGYVPASLRLAHAAPRPVLAVGAELKSVFCLARGDRAWLSHHIGDLQNLETLRSFTEGIAHFERLFDVRPEVVAHDLHPDYLSTRYALEREDCAPVAVQHHHAHLAACLAEHGEAGPVVGAIFDGTGLGSDGTIWGGELLAGDAAGFERAGHLWPVRLPGGEQAVRQPWRMACAWLQEALGEVPEPLAGIEPARWEAVASLARGELAAPVTTSMGRLLDAVGALCGIRSEIRYEGQAAIELEAAAAPGDHGAYEIALARDPSGGLVLDPRAALLAARADLAAGGGAAVVSARFHDGVAAATAAAVAALASERGLGTAVLSGGVFLNRRLLEGTAAALRAAGLRVLVPERVPPGDGGIALGQVAVAVAQPKFEARTRHAS
ncbi:MAG: hydrogenase maturation protein HypF [Solirubrobacteraceae bacterium]|nr:hydrogenase maturation protein HypF [Solirubrobacteraceae bacterium]